MSSRIITVAAVQMASGSWTIEDNLATAERLVRDAARQGANVVVCPELFTMPYFSLDQNVRHLRLAEPFAGNARIARFAKLAGELGVYRKTPIPDRAPVTRRSSTSRRATRGFACGTCASARECAPVHRLHSSAGRRRADFQREALREREPGCVGLPRCEAARQSGHLSGRGGAQDAVHADRRAARAHAPARPVVDEVQGRVVLMRAGRSVGGVPRRAGASDGRRVLHRNARVDPGSSPPENLR